jgi:hypothetical protein
MIRRAGHNISIKECNKNICTLKGKRADNGDEIESSFSIQDATNAGLANRDVWKKYTEDMLYARAMSRLARRLFPDVIGTAYVEGEIRDGDLITVVPDQKEEVLPQKESWPTENQDEYVTNEQSQFIFDILSECSPKYKEKFLKGLEVLGITISQIKKENFEKTKKALFAQRELHKKTSETSVET